jgi:site-specific DNA-methyltransferase (adenine-specific)
MQESTVIHGDALEVATRLPAGCVDLLYIDPPFFTNRERRHSKDGPGYDDRWPGGMAEYLAFVRGLVGASRRLLSSDGVFVLHLDWRAAHWGRIELESEYGPEGFINEIVWAYRTGGQSKRYLPRKHDTLLVFAGGKNYVYNPQQEKSMLRHRYGFKNVQIHDDGDGPYTWVALRDVWEIPALRGNMHEYSGYPTQKPLALLTRVVECFSNPGALVADLCCGSGTSLVAARDTGRRWLGVDINKEAVTLSQHRLSQT